MARQRLLRTWQWIVWLTSWSSRARAACTVDSFTAMATLSPAATGYFRALTWVPAASNSGTNLLLAGGEDQKLYVWQISGTSPSITGNHINTLGSIHGTIWALEWISTHSVVASGSGEGYIRIWPLSVLNNPQACHVEANGNGNNLCCDGDGLGCEGNYVVSWRDVPGMTHAKQVHAVEWIDSQSLLASSWSDGVVRLWDYDPANSPPLTYRNTLEVTGRAYSLTWLEGPGELAITSPDWTKPELWNKDGTTTASKVLTEELPNGFGMCPTAHCGAVHDSTANSGGTTLATASEDTKVKLWSANTGAMAHDFIGHSDPVTAVEWMISESKLVSGDSAGNLYLWDPTNAGSSSSLSNLAAHSAQVSRLLWMGDLDTLASASYDLSVKLWHCTSR